MASGSTWSPRSAYLYLVCLITLVMIVFSAANLVRAIVELVYPEPSSSAIGVPSVRLGEEPPQVDAKLLEEQREIQRQWSLRSGVIKLVGNGAMLALAGPLYLYHWRKIQRDNGSGPRPSG